MVIVRALFLVGALLAAVACSRGEPTGDEPRGHRAADARAAGARTVAAVDAVAATGPRIVFLGDSLTAGYGLDVEEAVPALVQARLREEGYDFEVVSHGVSGDTSAGGLSRLDYVLENDVAILVIELGGNDGLRGLPVDNLERNLSEIITRARARGVTVLLTGMEAPPNFGPDYTSSFRQVYRDLAHEHEVAFMPFYLEGVAGIEELNLDGIHPNAEGSRIIAENVWVALGPLLDATARDRGSAAP